MSEIIYKILQVLSCGQKYLKLGLLQLVEELKLQYLHQVYDLTLSLQTLLRLTALKALEDMGMCIYKLRGVKKACS